MPTTKNKTKPFDNDLYIKIQTENITKRIASFGGKLYLEFGGKLFDDLHAARVLPGFDKAAKYTLNLVANYLMTTMLQECYLVLNLIVS